MGEVSFGEWLQRRRKAMGLTQEQLAQQISCSTSALRKIEAEERRPSEQLIEQIANAFHVPSSERASFLKFARGQSDAALAEVMDAAPWHKSILPAHSNLPTPLTSFIGREKEQMEILRLIGKYRVVTLTGTGGTGKTRLALKIGEQLMGTYPNGVWLVDLAPSLDPLLVPRTAALALGLHDAPQGPLINMLCDYLREKEILILLDNCEHVLDACAQFADVLLKACPTLKILATSREALGILGEAVYHVPSLELPDPHPVLGRFGDFESVRLFEERAQLARTDFSLTTKNAPFVAKICTQLDGIPLAIELAAARVNMFSAEQIAARLQESFHLLTVGNRTALPRHQTLQAAIDWSYGLLSPAERILLRRLAVFLGGWTLESAEAVCAGETIDAFAVMDLLSNLVNKSLVLLEQNGRYKFLFTICRYAQKKLDEAGELEVIRQRHLMYFLAFAETNGTETRGSNQVAALQRLDEEYENIRAAMDWAIESGQVEEATQIGTALAWLYWQSQALFQEAYQKMMLILKHPHTTKEKLFRAAALISAVFHGSFMAWNPKQAQAMINEAIEIAELAGESGKTELAWAHAIWGTCMIGKDNSMAEEALDRATSIARELDDKYLLANIAEFQGALASIQKEYSRAQEFSSECIKLFRELGNHWGVARALGNIGLVLYLQRDYQRAKRHLEEALAIHRNIADKNNLITIIGLLGQISALSANYGQAAEFMEENLLLAKDRGWPQKIGICTRDLAYLHLYQGDPVPALALFMESLSSFQNDDPDEIGLTIVGIALALFHLSSQNAERAAQLLGSTQSIIDEIGLDNLLYEEPQIAKTSNAIRKHLGEARYRKLESQGKAMTLEAAVALAQEAAPP